MSWSMTPHACKQCFGRIMQTGDAFLCVTCGASTFDATPNAICGCGIQAKGTQRAKLGFKCGPNPNPTPASPAEIVILFNGPSS